MLPFCGYNMADYWAHWLSFRDKMDEDGAPPVLFDVNWFRKAPDGRWLWPGFGENSRVPRVDLRALRRSAEAVRATIGYLPSPGAIDTDGLAMSQEDMKDLLHVDKDEWRGELGPHPWPTSPSFPYRLPTTMTDQLASVEETRLACKFPACPKYVAPLGGVVRARSCSSPRWPGPAPPP